MPKSQPKGEKVFLFDAMSLIFRAFHAPVQTPLVSPGGFPTKAIYIFLRTLRKVLKGHRPDYTAVVFDLAAPTFRDKLLATYKANRPACPEDLGVQLPYVRRFIEALGLPIVEREGFEADDVIGTLAKVGTYEGLTITIVSGDQDLFQLVNDQVQILKPGRGPNDPEMLCDAQKVREILGVEPSQVVDWLALTGDVSDNIPGARPLPGRGEPSGNGKKRTYIGEKGATDLIRRFGTLQGALDRYQEVERTSYREALRDFRAEALLSRELATIRTDVPLAVGARDLLPRPIDLAQVTALCQELGFTSLLREFLAETPAPASAAAALAFEELRTDREAERWFRSLPLAAPVAIAMAIEGDEGFAGKLVALAFSDGSRRALVPVAAGSTLAAPALAALADAGRSKAIHNAKLLALMLAKQGTELRGVRDDPLLYSYLLEPLASSHSLADIVLRRQGRRLSGSPVEAAEHTRELAALLLPEVVRNGLKKVYDEIELPLTATVAWMEAAGVKIDPAILAAMSGDFDAELMELTHEIYRLAGGPFAIESPRQLGEVLFEKLKLAGGKKLKKSGQYATDASVLEALAAQHELPRKILEYRTRAKLKSTYIDLLPRFIDPSTGRLHSSFNQAGSRTGRLASANPNLQNIPIGDEFGERIRSAFVAKEGWRLIAADYSQIELRVLAHMSGDPLLIEAFSRDEDIHSLTAQAVFGVSPALQTHDHRRVAKAINYGVVYGLSSFGLAARTGTSKTEAQRYIDEYFEQYGKVAEFLERSVEQARATGSVRTLFGRLRPIPEINSRDVPSRNRSEREAMNMPVQGTAADLMKLAMVKLHHRLRRESLRTRMILTVHDELVFEAPESELDVASGIIRDEMENVFPMCVPLRVEVGVGENWKDAK